MKPINIEKKTYNVDDLAIMLDIPKTSVYRLIKQKKFVSFKIGKSYRISKESFDHWFLGVN